MTLQEVTEGRDDAEGQEVSPLRRIHHSAGLPSPAEPFRATSSPGSLHTLEITSSEIYTLSVQKTVCYCP